MSGAVAPSAFANLVWGNSRVRVGSGSVPTMHSGPRLFLIFIFLSGTACAVSGPPTTPRTALYSAAGAIEIPVAPSRDILPRHRFASDLANPRGMLVGEDGALLVATAGHGRGGAEAGDGALLRLVDHDGDGLIGGGSEREVRLANQPSRNIVEIVRRDEVFGVAAVARGDGTTLLSVADFGGPSVLYRVDDVTIVPWSRVHGNINDLVFNPGLGQWFGVSSSSDEVVRLRPGRGSDRVVKLPPLAGGQDPVPGYLEYEPQSGALLVSLFSGSTMGEEGGLGIELERRAGGIVRVAPQTGATTWLVRGLTAPTDLLLGPDGILYVLEFCSDFEDPVANREALARPGHGGFRRFSGRLLAIELSSGDVRVLAEGLDGPTNLARRSKTIFIAQGMGTPGRPLPGPEGIVPLAGFIDAVEIPTRAVPDGRGHRGRLSRYPGGSHGRGSRE